MYEIFKEFTFEAAHRLAVDGIEGGSYAKLHGHSFRVTVFLRGEPQPGTDWICDFGEIDRRIGEIRAVIDHSYLNDIEGLAIPTLENISRWIWQRLEPVLPEIDRVLVQRGSCGEGCTYRGGSR